MSSQNRDELLFSAFLGCAVGALDSGDLPAGRHDEGHADSSHSWTAAPVMYIKLKKRNNHKNSKPINTLPSERHANSSHSWTAGPVMLIKLNKQN
jgi:hypothetical protein